MAKALTLIWMSCLAIAVALSGCNDDGGSDEPAPTSSAPPTGTMPPATTTSPPGTGGEPMGPQYVNGTVSGVLDCTFIAQGAPTTGGDSQNLPAGMEGASYSAEKGADPSGAASICLIWDEGSTGTSGTVPEGATQFTVYVDGAPQGIPYSVLFTPL